MTLSKSSYQKTGYPFGFAPDDYEESLRYRELGDLREERTNLAELALRYASDITPGGNRAVLEYWITSYDRVIARKERLYAAHASDPLVPNVVDKAADTEARKTTVKAIWPIAEFCSEVLGAQLRSSGRNELISRCPLPGHDDSSPSFKVNPAKDVAFCHGCGRGGDILTLAGFFFGCTRFFDKLETIERLSGIDHAAIVTSIHMAPAPPKPISERFVGGRWVS